LQKGRIVELIKNIIFTLISPKYWLMLKTYNKHCDEWCITALKSPKIEIISEHRAKLNGKEIWISNYPYGFEFCGTNVRPSRLMVYRIFNAIWDFQWNGNHAAANE
jgi:hypothetical protein